MRARRGPPCRSRREGVLTPRSTDQRRRRRAAVFAPASCSFSMPIICSSVNRARFRVRPSNGLTLIRRGETLQGQVTASRGFVAFPAAIVNENIGRLPARRWQSPCLHRLFSFHLRCVSVDDMIEHRFHQLRIIEIGDRDGDDSELLFGAFSQRNELLDAFQPAGLRWRRKPGESAEAFERRIIADLRLVKGRAPEVDATP
jgi:hypothetical protein